MGAARRGCRRLGLQFVEFLLQSLAQFEILRVGVSRAERQQGRDKTPPRSQPGQDFEICMGAFLRQNGGRRNSFPGRNHLCPGPRPGIKQHRTQHKLLDLAGG